MVNQYFAMIQIMIVLGVSSAVFGSDATIGKKDSSSQKDYVIHPFQLAGKMTAQPGWLDSPAEKFGVGTDSSNLQLWCNGPGKGMKWSMMLPESIDLNKYRYATMRYKARNIKGHDYFILLGGNKGKGGKQKITCLKWMSGIKSDNEWHTTVVPVKASFKAVNMTLQIRSSGGRGEVWIDYIRLTANRPLFDAQELISSTEGWDESKLKKGTFKTVDFSACSENITQQHLDDFKVKSWFPKGKITVQKIPFNITGGTTAMVTPEDITKTVSCPIGESATEVYMLLASQPSLVNHTAKSHPLHEFSNPERFVVEVEYEDGIIDEMFPVQIKSGWHRIRRGFCVYCLTNLRPQVIRRISLKNKMSDGYFIMSGLTLNQSDGRIDEEIVLGLPEAVKGRSRNAGVGKISAIPGGYAIENNLIRMELQTKDGIALKSIKNYCLDDAEMHVKPGPLFVIGCQKINISKAGAKDRREQVVYGPQKGNKSDKTKDVLLSSEQVSIGKPRIISENSKKILIIPIDGTSKGVFLKGDIRFTVGDGPDILMNLNLVQVADKSFVSIVSFPLINDICIGAAEEMWYLWGVRGGVINHGDNVHHRNLTGHYALQLTDVFNPKAKGGLALFTYDTMGIKRAWDMRKNNRSGVSWRIDYLCQEYQPREKIEVAPTAIRAHTGDWRVAFKAYKNWIDSWYKPEVTRKKWFQKVFYYQQTTAWDHLLNKESGQWDVKNLVNKYRDYFGCLDYLHIYDFAKAPGHGRGMGDYDHYAIGGLDTMRSGIKEIQDMGVPVGLYMEGYLCDQGCQWGKENVLKYCVRRMKGNPKLWHDQEELPLETYMCAASAVWRNRLVDLCKLTAKNLKPNGIYLDEYGHLGSNNCWSHKHGHRVPSSTVYGERDTTKAVRDAMPDNIVILTEEAPNDINTQFQDGSITYAVRNAGKRETPSRINFLRFAIPSFKQFHIVQYTRYNDGAWELLKFPFFNGQGYWLHGGTTKWYSDDAHQFLKKAFAILHKYDDCFTSNDVEPLVPTLKSTLYANRFSSDKCTVWTLFNADYQTFRGDCLRVLHKPGTSYIDAFTEMPIAHRIENGYAIVTVVIGPRGVGCVAESNKL